MYVRISVQVGDSCSYHRRMKGKWGDIAGANFPFLAATFSHCQSKQQTYTVCREYLEMSQIIGWDRRRWCCRDQESVRRRRYQRHVTGKPWAGKLWESVELRRGILTEESFSIWECVECCPTFTTSPWITCRCRWRSGLAPEESKSTNHEVENL